MKIKWVIRDSTHTIKKEFCVPPSKSHTIRAVAIASLASGQSIIRNPLVSSDTLSAVSCYRQLGAEIDTGDSSCWKVIGTAGQIKSPRGIIDVGNSGTTLRIAMGSAALAQAGQVSTLTGDKQIQSRSIGPLMEALSNLGAKCTSVKNNGKVPVEVMGGLRGGRTAIAATTSQYLSSLLLCAPLAKEDTEIDVTILNEPGYVQMTLDWLDKQGIEYENRDFREFKIKGNQKYKAFDAVIPADFSSATFFFCAGALLADKPIRIKDLDFSDSQPDKAVVDYLKAMGADIQVNHHSGIVTVKQSFLKGVEIDMNKTPDALPAMAVTAAFAQGTTKLLNVPQARGKETDRIKCMAEELKKININVEELKDGLIIRESTIKPPPCAFDGRSDHRIVMALILAGMMLTPRSHYCSQCTIIETGEAMSVTFPKYVELMHGLGKTIEPAGTSYAISRLLKKFKKPTEQRVKETTCSRLERNKQEEFHLKQ